MQIEANSRSYLYLTIFFKNRDFGKDSESAWNDKSVCESAETHAWLWNMTYKRILHLLVTCIVSLPVTTDNICNLINIINFISSISLNQIKLRHGLIYVSGGTLSVESGEQECTSWTSTRGHRVWMIYVSLIDDCAVCVLTILTCNDKAKTFKK